jgi:hypothetical protein
MQICLLLDRSRVLRWHMWLADALTSRPNCDVSLVFVETTAPLPRAIALILEIESLVYGRRAEHALDQITGANLSRYKQPESAPGAIFDVVVDLVGCEQSLPRCRRHLTTLFNSRPGDAGAILAVLDERAVHVTISDSGNPLEALEAWPAMSARRVLTKALDNVLSCAVELILKALSLPGCLTSIAQLRRGDANHPQMPSPATVLASMTQTLTWKARRFLTMLISGGETWATGWRLDRGNPLINSGYGRFSILPDDRRRYYADPFPFCYHGERFVFVEEFEFAAQRGCISVASIGADGAVSTPRRIIEEPHHLSFPFVFEHGGQIWMIPESGAAGRVDLYRAETFPYRWKREGALLDGVAAYDATLLPQAGRLWMFVTIARWNASTCDNLCIFHANQLSGPWHAHSANPILLDATASRSAGAFFHLEGSTFRLAQDCSEIYGGAVTIWRLDTLNDGAFSQTEMGRITSSAAGCHTYNRHSGLEVLDVFGELRETKHAAAWYRPRARRAHDHPGAGNGGSMEPRALAG